MKSFVICCSCNGNKQYINYLKALINSIKINNPGVDIHVRLVNCSDDIISSISATTRVEVMRDNIVLNNKQHTNHVGKHITHGVKYLLTKYRGEPWGVCSTEAFYTCMIKYHTMLLLLKKYKCVLYVDVDTLVLNNVNILTDIMSGYDTGLYFDTELKNFPHAGLIVANNTSKMINVLSDMYCYFDKCIQSGNIKIGEGDGDLLFDKCISYNLNINRLDKIWKDEGPVYKDVSVMWSGRSNNKINNNQYKKLYEKYRQC